MRTLLFANWRISTLSLLVLCLFQFSCNDKSIKMHNEIVIPDLARGAESTIPASTIFESVRIIKLETSDQALLAGIGELELYDGCIAVLDMNRGFIAFFDEEGNYIRKLFAQGRGLGEYIAIDDFLIDKDESTIEILDANARMIHIYDLTTLDYKQSIPISIRVFSFAKAEGYYYFQTNGYLNKINGFYTKSEIIAYDYQREKYHPIFDKEAEFITNEPQYSYEFFKIFYTNQQGVVFASLAWGNQIYELAGTSAVPFVTLDPGRRAFPREVLQGSFDEKLAYLASSSSEGKLGFFKLVYQHQDAFLIGCRRSFETEENFVFSFDGEDVFFAGTITNDFYPFDNQELFLPGEVQGYFLSVVYPYQMEEELRGKLGVSETDNPIILLFDLKNDVSK